MVSNLNYEQENKSSHNIIKKGISLLTLFSVIKYII